MKMDTCIGEDTVCTVEFDYSPEEERIYYGALAHPGCEESVDITGVWVGNGDFYEDLSKQCLDRLEQECIDYVHLMGTPKRERDYD
jgi:hypothetical protein